MIFRIVRDSGMLGHHCLPMCFFIFFTNSPSNLALCFFDPSALQAYQTNMRSERPTNSDNESQKNVNLENPASLLRAERYVRVFLQSFPDGVVVLIIYCKDAPCDMRSL